MSAAKPVITIEWLEDDCHCETCGWTIAQGARVIIGGETAFEMTPIAHCFGGQDFGEADVLKAIIEHLGYAVEEAR